MFVPNAFTACASEDEPDTPRKRSVLPERISSRRDAAKTPTATEPHSQSDNATVTPSRGARVRRMSAANASVAVTAAMKKTAGHENATSTSPPAPSNAAVASRTWCSTSLLAAMINATDAATRSEEHTSELQSHHDL